VVIVLLGYTVQIFGLHEGGGGELAIQSIIPIWESTSWSHQDLFSRIYHTLDINRLAELRWHASDLNVKMQLWGLC